MLPPPRTVLPVLEKLKSGYKLWHEYHELIPKTQKYSLGKKIDNLFIETIEAVATAGFLQKEEKIPWIRLAIRKMDTMKVLLSVLWETKSMDDKKYIALSEKLDECGRNLGGWYGKMKQEILNNKTSAQK